MRVEAAHVALINGADVDEVGIHVGWIQAGVLDRADPDEGIQTGLNRWVVPPGAVFVVVQEVL